MSKDLNIVALTGGVGGAKLALGLTKVLSPENLSLVVNTGDDFQHLGLHISPDIDTLLYTLSGLENPKTGWGRNGETWSFMSALKELGGETWFQLGDKDLATNVYRTAALQAGMSLSDITQQLARRRGINNQIIPMSDDPVRTRITTDDGILDFQEYFVKHQCKPAVREISFDGIETALPTSRFQQLLESDTIDAFILCPSNPYLSMEPILALPNVRDLLAASKACVIGISPVVAGDSLKGPTSKIMQELGLACSSRQIAAHYQDIVDGWIIDDTDTSLTSEIEELGIAVENTNVIMRSLQDRINLATATLEMVTALRRDF